jgi:hypothetical protein
MKIPESASDCVNELEVIVVHCPKIFISTLPSTVDEPFTNLILTSF